MTGKYRGAAHKKCNLEYRIPKFLPVIFHNLSSYDCRLFIKKLSSGGGQISCIPNNEEKFISFSNKIVVDNFINKIEKETDVKREIRFIDSYRFMNYSLDYLSKNLKSKNFNELSKYHSGREFKLLKQKGIFPYEYVSGVEKLSKTSLPPRDAFYSSLTGKGISDEEYEFANKAW